MTVEEQEFVVGCVDFDIGLFEVARLMHLTAEEMHVDRAMEDFIRMHFVNILPELYFLLTCNDCREASVCDWLCGL